MKLVIFDCDGTLVDSQNGIVTAMARALDGAGQAPVTRDQILSGVGLSLELAVARLLPDQDREVVRDVATRYRDCFREIRQDPAHHEPLYDGMIELVHTLSSRDDHLLGVATGKSVNGTRALLARFGLRPHFVTVQTADTHPSKPHPSMIETAMREAGVAAQRTVMIGDTTFDIEMAHNAGVKPIGVGWGYHPVLHLERCGAVTVAEDAAQLLAVIDRCLDRHDGGCDDGR